MAAAWNGAVSCFEILNKVTLCCNDQNESPRCKDMISKSGEDMHQLAKAKKMGVPELSPEDEVEGELIYFQHRLLGNAVARKHCIGLYIVVLSFENLWYCFVFHGLTHFSFANFSCR